MLVEFHNGITTSQYDLPSVPSVGDIVEMGEFTYVVKCVEYHGIVRRIVWIAGIVPETIQPHGYRAHIHRSSFPPPPGSIFIDASEYPHAHRVERITWVLNRGDKTLAHAVIHGERETPDDPGKEEIIASARKYAETMVAMGNDMF